MQTGPNATNFRNFLTAFTGSWLATVSGALSVPFAIIALYVSNWYQKILWGVLAIAGALYASYLVWSEKNQALEELRTQFQSEKARNTRPILRGTILQMYVAPYRDPTVAGGIRFDVYLYIKAVIHNDSPCQTTIRSFGLAVEDADGIHTTEYLGEV